MYKLFLFIFLSFLISCESKQDNSTKSIIDTSIASAVTVQDADPSKPHQTFNEVINVPDELKSFLPQGYSAICLASGDANLDGRTDKILVLRKNTEEVTSDNAN